MWGCAGKLNGARGAVTGNCNWSRSEIEQLAELGVQSASERLSLNHYQTLHISTMQYLWSPESCCTIFGCGYKYAHCPWLTSSDRSSAHIRLIFRIVLAPYRASRKLQNITRNRIRRNSDRKLSERKQDQHSGNWTRVRIRACLTCTLARLPRVLLVFPEFEAVFVNVVEWFAFFMVVQSNS